MGKKAVIVGASGLIGSKLLDILTAKHDYAEIVSLARRKKRLSHKRLTQEIIDFDKPEDYSHLVSGDVIFCCLGTTRDKTPDLDEYRKIDHDYAVRFAELARRNGIEQFHLVSAVGADAKSSNFYLKIKGETERDVKEVGLKSLHVYQPSLLTGRDRKKRFGERVAGLLMKIINPLLIGRLAKYRSIAAGTVAIGMYNKSLSSTLGVHVYTTDIIKKIK